MSKALSTALKFATVASAIPLMVACGQKDETYAPVQQTPKTVPTSNAFKSIDECGHKQLDSALEIAGKTKDDLTGTEYEDQLRETTATCKAAYDSALAQHQSSRPRFADKSDCEKEFGAGQCENTNTTQSASGNTTTIIRERDSSYSPLFTYFLMSQMMNNNNNSYNHYDNGYNAGRNSGYDAGRSSGYDSGREAGRREAEREAARRAAAAQSTPVYKTRNNDNYVTPSGNTFNSTTIREAGKDAFAKPATPPPVVSKGGEYATKPYTPPASVTYNAPTRVPVAPAPRNTDAYKPSTSSNAGSTSRAAPPPAPPAARPSTPPSAPVYRSAPSPSPSRNSGYSSGSSSRGGGGGFGGGGGRSP